MIGNGTRARPGYPNPELVKAGLAGPRGELLRQIAALPVNRGPRK